MPDPTPELEAACEAAILALLAARAAGGSICPSEAARQVARGTGTDWRGLMPAVRAAADRLRARGAIAVTQRGAPVASTSLARGPVRLRLAASP